jgi:thiol-disulfide isomerase/thioredoxin
MKKTIFIIVFLLASNIIYCANLKISSRIENNDAADVTFVFSRNPFTSEKNQVVFGIDKNGTFVFEHELNAPRFVIFTVGEDPSKSGRFYAFPDSEIEITVDAKNFKSSLKISGNKQGLTKISNALFSKFFTPDTSYFNESIQDWTLFRKNLEIHIDKKYKLLNELKDDVPLTDNEIIFAKSKIYFEYFNAYMRFSSKFRYPLDHPFYDYYKLVDMNNNEFALISDEYNTLIGFALYHKYRVSNGISIDSIQPKEESFPDMYYYSKEHLSGTVREVGLTRELYYILNTGVPGAEKIYQDFIETCKTPEFLNIIENEYNLYFKTLNTLRKSSYEIITNPPSTIKEFLSGYKGNVLLIEFWGSWCRPCIRIMPYINNLHAEFDDKKFQVIHVATKDSYKQLKFAIEKYKVKGVNVLLPKDLLKDWRQEINFYTVPYFAIIDKEGNITEQGPIDTYLPGHLKEAIMKELK